jgi:hypothetical protein
MANALSPTMTVREFENGYWYREQLKDFAERIGIPAETTSSLISSQRISRRRVQR